MLPLRFRAAWIASGWLMVLGVSLGSLLPGELISVLIWQDKLTHGATYCLLMVWFSGMFERRLHWRIAILLLLLGLALDMAQGVVSTRSFDWMDVAANGGGILVGFMLARFAFSGWCHRVEQWFSD